MVKMFEYRKNNDQDLDKIKLHQSVIIKTLLIAKVLYLDYLLIFLFNNATNHFFYRKNILCTGDINKNSRGKQLYLCNY